MLRDLEEDLLYSDEIDEKEKNKKLYFTQDELAIMTGLWFIKKAGAKNPKK